MWYIWYYSCNICIVCTNRFEPSIPWEFLLHNRSSRFRIASSEISSWCFSASTDISGPSQEILMFCISVVTWESWYSKDSFSFFSKYSLANDQIRKESFKFHWSSQAMRKSRLQAQSQSKSPYLLGLLALWDHNLSCLLGCFGRSLSFTIIIDIQYWKLWFAVCLFLSYSVTHQYGQKQDLEKTRANHDQDIPKECKKEQWFMVDGPRATVTSAAQV